MTALAATLAALLAALFTVRGWRRGARATLLRWLPALAATLILVVAVQLAWAMPARFALILLAGCIGSAAVWAAAFFALRRRRASRPARADIRVWERAGGAALGLIEASMACLALACLVSAVPFAFHITAAPAPGDPAAARAWSAVGRACCSLADFADSGVLSHVPGIQRYSREVRALVHILNAPPDSLRRLALRRGLDRLLDLPPVRDALEDRDYLELIARVGHGDLAAIGPIASSPHTARLLASPEIRRLAQTLTPSELTRDLDAN